MSTKRIGKSLVPSAAGVMSKTRLRESLTEMKSHASPRAYRLLNIVGNLAFGRANAGECLLAIESLLEQLKASDIVVKKTNCPASANY
jgi:hypothetical protein